MDNNKSDSLIILSVEMLRKNCHKMNEQLHVLA
jgi:hypothetical protein